MKSLLIVLGLSLLSASAQTLAEAQQRWESAQAAAAAQHKDGLAQLNESYAASVREAQQKVGDNLELAALLDGELQKLGAGQAIARDPAAPAWLQQAQTRVQAQRAELAERQEVEQRAALQQYRASLDALKSALSKSGRTAELPPVEQAL